MHPQRAVGRLFLWSGAKPLESLEVGYGQAGAGCAKSNNFHVSPGETPEGLLTAGEVAELVQPHGEPDPSPRHLALARLREMDTLRKMLAA